ncbi:MAG: DUF695 domain-containing protein [Chitinophagaceae bacterium]
MQKLLVNLALAILPLIVTAQEDQWDVYMAQYDKAPGSVVLNMSVKKNAPDNRLPFICITGVKFSDCNPEGLPNQSVFQDLYRIADSVKSSIDQLVKNNMVGSFTYQCERLDYFYVADTMRLRSLLMQLYQKYFPGYTPYINIKEDRKWEVYLNFLYPNEETFEFMQNQKVVMQLEKAGDKLDKERQVDHWLYFNTERDRNCFIESASKLNYKVEAKEKIKEADHSFKLQISKTEKVELALISKTTLELRRQAIKCNGRYDGWETFVIKE